MTTVVLLGTLDTKGIEYAWLREQLEAAGMTTVVVDVGTFPAKDGPCAPDVTAAEVAAAAGADLDALAAAGDRGAAMRTMGEGAAAVVVRLLAEGRLDAVLAAAGSGGSSVAAHAMQALPVGVPKLLVSTMASGDVSPYVGASDVTLMYSVVDAAGINSISRRVLGNAVAAAVGMATHHAAVTAAGSEPDHGDRPLIGASMFGVTTPAVDAARERLTDLGYEVIVFHATGAGGRAMEALTASGYFAGILDLTTTELADQLVGGVLTAGPDRLTAAGRHGVPQVVSVGALDMVNFGPRESVPTKFDTRTFLVHNPTVTLMRTTQAEMATLGAQLAAKVRGAQGPVEVFLPLNGVSGVDVPGGPFADPEADAALFAAVRDGLAGSGVPIHESATDINDPTFAVAAADALHRLIQNRTTEEMS